MSHQTSLLNFLNAFNLANTLTPIDNIDAFTCPKSLVIKKGNASIFSVELLSEMFAIFTEFEAFHEKNKDQVSYMIIVLKFLVPFLNDKTNAYDFVIKGTDCMISHEIIRNKVHNICACLRNSEVRRKLRETDEYANCICGLFSYRDQPSGLGCASNLPEISHMSFGDGKLKGGFFFRDSMILYNFVLNSEHRDKYLFVENKTDTFQAYFDLDYKLNKHGLEQWLRDDQIESLTSHIVATICDVITNRSYVYADKTIGNGIHLYFPQVILNKKKLARITDEVTTKLIETNILQLPRADNVNSRVYKCIVDSNAVHNGLVLLFQDKGGAHYKINMEKSTFDGIPIDPVEQLKLCSLRICV